MPVSSLLHYHLQIYYYNEVWWGYCELGNYNLQPQHSTLNLSQPSDKALSHHIPSTDEKVPSTTLSSDDNDDKVADSG